MPHRPGPQHPDLDVLVAALWLGHVDELETGACRDLPERAHAPILPGTRADAAAPGREPPPFVVRRPPFGAL